MANNGKVRVAIVGATAYTSRETIQNMNIMFGLDETAGLT